MEIIKKGHAKDSQRYKVDYESQSTDTQNFSSESKRETEYVSLTLPVGGGLSVEGPFPLWDRSFPLWDLTGSPIPSPGPFCGDLTGPREPWLVLSRGGVAGPSTAAWDSLRPCTLRSNQSLPPQGPCRREVEDTLNRLKFLDMLSPRGIHIPNCDRKGFYKKKQCRPSKGRKRGFCWCVDKYGQPLPGFDARGKGDIHCYSMDSK
uniref:Insulin like growth factor binding protein 3 n=1 Tax=Ailuropoda melanoleuca TaxID=9646 RepID=A0A7N5KNP4_AILME